MTGQDKGNVSPSMVAISRDGFVALTYWVKAREMKLKAHITILLFLGDEVLREVGYEETTIEVWEKL
ncbi:hypothetical protein MA16_Dca006269 [Dendrobium catenatum]|uniref:Uncharacterized protein n=1 Tax=Dendrobium catenatum TaxID=906689 RepID=A0A2I0W9D4_9ASPA|nr:hypothetical protein MA16_Dca006269 [Dendrobium catenatum]